MPRTIASDGVVTLRPSGSADAALLIEGRDEESLRWLGPENSDPAPTALIIVNGDVVGWVDYDAHREWLEADEVNIGYNVFPGERRRGYASRAVELFVGHLARSTSYRTATLLINAENIASLAVAAKLGCEAHGDIVNSRYFKLPIQRQNE